MSKLWRFPADEKKRTPCEQKTYELLQRFIDHACDVLERRGYVVIEQQTICTSQWDIERILVGRADIVKEYLENRYGPINQKSKLRAKKRGPLDSYI